MSQAFTAISITRQLRVDILAKRLAGKLPSERQLSSDYGLAYMTVRSAVGELVDQGLLVRVPGIGTFTREHAPVRPQVGRIGVILPPSQRFGVANHFYGEVVDGILRAARRLNLSTLVAEHLDELVPGVREDSRLHVDGVIACGIGSISREAVLHALRFIPISGVNINIDGVPNAAPDNSGGVRQALDHLWSLGHRHIGIIAGAKTNNTADERLQAARQYFLEKGVALSDNAIAYGDFEFDSGEQGARILLQQAKPPTAIWCANDAMAFGCVRACWHMGLQVPRDISIIGFDDVPAAGYATPGLTTIAVDKGAIGEQAVARLFTADPIHCVRIPTILQVRDTTASPRRDA